MDCRLMARIGGVLVRIAQIKMSRDGGFKCSIGTEKNSSGLVHYKPNCAHQILLNFENHYQLAWENEDYSQQPNGCSVARQFNPGRAEHLPGKSVA